MYVKLSMKEVHRAALSEHEYKRCRIESRGSPWQVWEEDILWYSLDRIAWHPVYDDKWQQRRRRWLMVEAEDGTYPALLWDITEGIQIPAETKPSPADAEPAYRSATVSDFERLLGAVRRNVTKRPLLTHPAVRLAGSGRRRLLPDTYVRPPLMVRVSSP